jgi:hypothetical protein
VDGELRGESRAARSMIMPGKLELERVEVPEPVCR